MTELQTFGDWFEPYFSESLRSELSTFNQIHTTTTLAQHGDFIGALAKSGKRLRPYMCALGYLAGGQTNATKIATYLVALEHFHTFCLVHDDIIDQSTQRRGVDTVHVGIGKNLSVQPQLKHQRLGRVAEGEAMLFGDLLLALACRLFADTQPDVQQEFFAMVHEVVAGQMIDIETSLFPEADSLLIEKKMYYKTATYTFVRPFQIGLALAGVSTAERQRLSAFAVPLGIAFQIQDDYLDLAGDPAITGKSILSDIREGQHTVFSQHVLTQGEPELRDAFQHVFGNPEASDQDLTALQTQLLQSEAIRHGRSVMAAYFQTAKDGLAEAKLPTAAASAVNKLIKVIESRRA